MKKKYFFKILTFGGAFGIKTLNKYHKNLKIWKLKNFIVTNVSLKLVHSCGKQICVINEFLVHTCSIR